MKEKYEKEYEIIAYQHEGALEEKDEFIKKYKVERSLLNQKITKLKNRMKWLRHKAATTPKDTPVHELRKF